MNHEHKVLLKLMDELQEKNHISFDKKALLEAFDALVRYTRTHFADEEKFMDSIGYPGFAQHQRIHQGLLDALMRYREEFDKNVNTRFPSSVFDFFKTWITTHILLVDKQYAQFVDERFQDKISS